MESKSGNFSGFTLVELLVAIAIVGIISVISVQSLYDSISFRSKQYSIEDSSDNYRSLVKLITGSVLEAQSISILSSSEMEIIGEGICRTIVYDGTASVRYGQATGASCIPPDCSAPDYLGCAPLNGNGVLISNFSLSPIGTSPGIVTLELEGISKNSLGEHPFKYQTTITPRVSI